MDENGVGMARGRASRRGGDCRLYNPSRTVYSYSIQKREVIGEKSSIRYMDTEEVAWRFLIPIYWVILITTRPGYMVVRCCDAIHEIRDRSQRPNRGNKIEKN